MSRPSQPSSSYGGGQQQAPFSSRRRSVTDSQMSGGGGMKGADSTTRQPRRSIPTSQRSAVRKGGFDEDTYHYASGGDDSSPDSRPTARRAAQQQQQPQPSQQTQYGQQHQQQYRGDQQQQQYRDPRGASAASATGGGSYYSPSERRGVSSSSIIDQQTANNTNGVKYRMGSVGPPFPSEYVGELQRGGGGRVEGRQLSSTQQGYPPTSDEEYYSQQRRPTQQQQQQHQQQQQPHPSQQRRNSQQYSSPPPPAQQYQASSRGGVQSHSIGTGSSPPSQHQPTGGGDGYMNTPRAGGGHRPDTSSSSSHQQQQNATWQAQYDQRQREHQHEREGTVIGADGRVTFQPNNVGMESSLRKDYRTEQEEKAKVRWAWSVDRAGRVSKPLMSAIANGPLKNELHEIVRLLSSNTVDVQTTLQPSYTAELAGRDDASGEGVDAGSNVPNIVTDHLRSVGTQNGLGLSKVNASMQVVEGDIASTAPTAQLDYNKLVLMQQNQQDTEQQDLLARALDVQGSGGAFDGGNGMSTYVKGVKTGGDGMHEMGVSSGAVPESLHHVVQRAPDGTLRVVSNNTSAHFPYCGIPSEEFPVLMAEARRQGVANQYGFISMPTQPFSLPPRRKVRAIQPVDFPHLYGSHHLHIDEQSSTQLSRAYTLWTQCTGFVPKF